MLPEALHTPVLSTLTALTVLLVTVTTAVLIEWLGLPVGVRDPGRNPWFSLISIGFLLGAGAGVIASTTMLIVRGSPVLLIIAAGVWMVPVLTVAATAVRDSASPPVAVLVLLGVWGPAGLLPTVLGILNVPLEYAYVVPIVVWTFLIPWQFDRNTMQHLTDGLETGQRRALLVLVPVLGAGWALYGLTTGSPGIVMIAAITLLGLIPYTRLRNEIRLRRYDTFLITRAQSAGRGYIESGKTDPSLGYVDEMASMIRGPRQVRKVILGWYDGVNSELYSLQRVDPDAFTVLSYVGIPDVWRVCDSFAQASERPHAWWRSHVGDMVAEADLSEINSILGEAPFGDWDRIGTRLYEANTVLPHICTNRDTVCPGPMDWDIPLDPGTDTGRWLEHYMRRDLVRVLSYPSPHSDTGRKYCVRPQVWEDGTIPGPLGSDPIPVLEHNPLDESE